MLGQGVSYLTKIDPLRGSVYCLVNTYMRHERKADILYIGWTSDPERRYREHLKWYQSTIDRKLMISMIVLQNGNLVKEVSFQCASKAMGFSSQNPWCKRPRPRSEMIELQEILHAAVLLHISRHKPLGKRQLARLQRIKVKT